MYIKKNSDGKIIAYTSEPMPGSELVTDENDPEILEFIERPNKEAEKKEKDKSSSEILMKYFAKEILTNPDAPQDVLDAAAELLEE